ncbi:MAG: TonB-dependent receptor, partial [Thermodesulfovibrionales bacterium]|nr:TonB-dependent receptor [Thermodesulfovibrionales bacterium]
TVCALLLFATGASGHEPENILPDNLKNLAIEQLMEIEVATVYGASKYEQKVTEAPSSITIITSNEIKKYGHRSLVDVLKSIRGFYVTYDRNYSYIGVRGFNRPGDYNARILLLLDGHRVNDNIYDSALIGAGLNIDIIDRIEVIRGPGASLYGSSAFFAVINIITRKGADLQGLEASGEAAGFDTYKGGLILGKKLDNGLDFILSGAMSDSNGQDLFYREFDGQATDNGIAEGCDYSRTHSLFSKFFYRGFTLEATYFSITKGIPTASYETVFNDPRTQATDERGFVSLNYSIPLGSTSEMQAEISYNHSHYYGKYLYDTPPLTLNEDESWGSWWGGELKLISKFIQGHTVTLGSEFRDNFRQDQKNYDKSPYFLYLNDTRDSTLGALYIQDEVALMSNITLNAGIRYDHYRNFGGTTNPRLAVIYNPYQQIFLKLLYGRAFRAPNVYELYYNDSGNTMKANPHLDPETITTYEIVLEYFFKNTFFITVSGYDYKIKNLISQQSDPADGLLVFRNVEEIEAKGIEFAMKGKWEGLEGKISYTRQEAENARTGECLTNSPKHLAKLNLIVPLIKEKLFLGLEEQYMSKRKTLENRYTDSLFITNLTILSQKLAKGLEVSGSIYNLFDEKYSDPGAGEHIQDMIEQDGVNFRFKVTYLIDI